MMGNLLWNIIELINAKWLWNEALLYYHEKKFKNDMMLLIAFDPHLVQMRLVYGARIATCIEKLEN